MGGGGGKAKSQKFGGATEALTARWQENVRKYRNLEETPAAGQQTTCGGLVTHVRVLGVDRRISYSLGTL